MDMTGPMPMAAANASRGCRWLKVCSVVAQWDPQSSRSRRLLNIDLWRDQTGKTSARAEQLSPSSVQQTWWECFHKEKEKVCILGNELPHAHTHTISLLSLVSVSRFLRQKQGFPLGRKLGRKKREQGQGQGRREKVSKREIATDLVRGHPMLILRRFYPEADRAQLCPAGQLQFRQPPLLNHPRTQQHQGTYPRGPSHSQPNKQGTIR
ncbi:hypothetical protein B0T10DRAFT_102353 [Thelonectria olida]|uniref:Uncharacterized protein n=1 Tax=Thelonectria olida TaxID=1576542 RepID=A0A9P9AXZ0_9HYPO|nr:hypothetical protein B0T10DRAFT_102353 [Thelonectria olida]